MAKVWLSRQCRKISRPWNPGQQSTQVIECGIPKDRTRHQNTFSCALSENPRLSRWAVRAFEETKREKHARYNFTHLSTPFASATVFCVWGRTVDIFKHAKFKVNRFMGFGAPGAENDPHPLNWHIALTTTHALTTTLRFLVTGPPSRTVTLRDKRQFWSSTSDFTPLLRALPS